MDKNNPLYLATDESLEPAGVNNSLPIRAVRAVYGSVVEPVARFFDSLSEKATRAFVGKTLKEIEKEEAAQLDADIDELLAYLTKRP